MLTAKEESFCNDVASGMTLTDAYKDSYNAENMSDKTINEKASLLAKKDKVRTRIDELREKASNKTIMNTIQRKEWLTNLIMQDEKASKTDKLKALDILNKMDGEYVTKIQGEVELADIRVELRDD
jgi:phage terminase small subunit